MPSLSSLTWLPVLTLSAGLPVATELAAVGVPGTGLGGTWFGGSVSVVLGGAGLGSLAGGLLVELQALNLVELRGAWVAALVGGVANVTALVHLPLWWWVIESIEVSLVGAELLLVGVLLLQLSLNSR
jgi:hypothetical protein